MEASEEKQRGVVRFMVAKGAWTRYKVQTPWNAVGRNHPFAWWRPSHTANLERDNLQRFGWEHLNIFRTAPCDFHIFDDLKEDIRGHRFHSDEEVQWWVRLWIHQRASSFYDTGIDRLVSQWDKCINSSGNYFSIKQIPLLLSSGCSVSFDSPHIFNVKNQRFVIVLLSHNIYRVWVIGISELLGLVEGTE